jgi:hypothetical protein
MPADLACIARVMSGLFLNGALVALRWPGAFARYLADGARFVRTWSG